MDKSIIESNPMRESEEYEEDDESLKNKRPKTVVKPRLSLLNQPAFLFRNQLDETN